MGRMRFGKQETITCIVDVDATVGHAEPACLAYKTSAYYFVGGIYLSDDGYVLKPRGVQNVYYNLTPEAVAGNVEGIPHPLPPYSIPFMEYAIGYSLWGAIGAVIVWTVGQRQFRKKKQAAFARREAELPIDRGPPRLDTEGDRFVYETIKRQLSPGESVVHQAYASSWDYNNDREGDDVFFVVLSTKRLFVIKTRKGAFKILFENEGIDITERTAIAAAQVDHGKVLFVTTNDGVQRGYLIKPTSALSNQDAFLLNAGRILSETSPHG